jgi:thiosulfate/3-mercaptopyruvate sulfurtransferase
MRNFIRDFKETRIRLFTFLSIFVLLGLCSFVSADNDTLFPNSSLIFDLQVLNDNLGRNDLVVVDARSATLYKNGHIPDAINIPVTMTFDRKPNDDRVASIQRIQSLIAAAGITTEMTLVIYDDGTYIDAARLFWVLETYGHKSVHVLNGGMDAWISSGFPISLQARHLPPSKFVPTIVPERLATKLKIRLALDNPTFAIIDARTEEEYEGKKSVAVRSGHIPRAINIPWNSNFTRDHGVLYLKSEPELSELYAGIDKDNKVITYCNKGKQSALIYFVMRNLGYDISVYDGSWYEWGNDTNMPIYTP